MLDGLLSVGKIQQAQDFIKTSMADLDSFTPKQFCENETVNLLCSYYHSKASDLGVLLTIKALLLLESSSPLPTINIAFVASNEL